MDVGSNKTAPFTAAGFCVNVVNVVAASYFTACDEAFSNSKMQRIYRAWLKDSLAHDINITEDVQSITHPMSGIIFTIQPYNLNNTHLQQLI